MGLAPFLYSFRPVAHPTLAGHGETPPPPAPQKYVAEHPKPPITTYLKQAVGQLTDDDQRPKGQVEILHPPLLLAI